MKKNLIKKVFAVSLSIAMACSFLPAANPVTASAAAPFVTLKTTFKTLKVGQKYKMTLKNNTINWKIKKVETTNKTIATVYGKTTSQVMIKGKSEGRATIRVKVKTSKRKANNTKTLRCRVKVVPGTTVDDQTTPVQTEATVETQAALDAALANSNITKITIKPTTGGNFVIAPGSYQNVDLIVDAPQSEIENSATFKSITINNIKTDTWTEKGTGNTFTILAKAARLIVDKAASVKGVTIGTTDSKINLVVNGGTVGGVNVTAKSELNITGEAATDAALIPVTFGTAAADSVFTTELPVAVSMSASVELIFEKGAVKSTVKLEVANITATITNKTSEAIVVTKNDGKTTQTITPGSVKSVANAVSTSTTPTPGTSTGGSSTGGSSVNKQTTPYKINTGSAIWVSVSGSGYGLTTITKGSLEITIDGVTTTQGSLKSTNVPVGYSVRISQNGKSTTLGSGDLTAIYQKETEQYIYTNESTPNNNLTPGKFDISGFMMNEPITLTISIFVKETDQYGRSASVQKTISTLSGNPMTITGTGENDQRGWSYGERFTFE